MGSTGAGERLADPEENRTNTKRRRRTQRQSVRVASPNRRRQS